MRIRIYPDPILACQCDQVNLEDQDWSNIEDIVSDMFKLMDKRNGVGLAAPQVGIKARFFVWSTGYSKHAIINPELKNEQGRFLSREGCLSLPGVNISTERAKSATLYGLSPRGLPVEYAGNISTTRIWQHEIDHLDGKSLTDLMSSSDKYVNRIILGELVAASRNRNNTKKKRK